MTSGPLSQGHFLIASSQDSFFVRVVGLATMTNTVRLQEVLEECRRRGLRRYIFDLGGCQGFDSTFMGILLGVALSDPGRKAIGAPEAGGDPRVILVNASEAHQKLLCGVGIDRMVCLHSRPVEFPDVEMERLEERPAEPLRRIRSMVIAHENLLRLGGENIGKFGAMLDILKRELGGSGPS